MNRRCKIVLALTTLLAFHLINNYIWLKINQSFLLFDAAGYYVQSLKVYDAILERPLFPFFDAMQTHKWHGPLVGMVTAPFYFIFGRSEEAAVMISAAIFLAILIFSVYGIGRRLGNENIGIFSSFIATMYPLIFYHSRTYLLDFPLTAMVALSMYTLLLTDNFEDKRFALIFGIVAGLSLLVKFNYVLFTIGPLSVILYRMILKKNNDLYKNKLTKKRAFKSYIIIFSIVLCITLCFYVLKFRDVSYRVYDTSIWRAIKEKTFPSSHDWVFNFLNYFKLLTTQSLSFLLSFVFIISIFFYIRLKTREKWILLLPVILPIPCLFFLFRIPANYMLRYSMPLLPFMAIISAVGISSIGPRFFVKRIIVAVIVICSILQFFTMSYGNVLFPQKIPSDSPISLYYSSVLYKETKEVLAHILNLRNQEKKIRFFFLDNMPEISMPLDYIVIRDKMMISIFDVYRIDIEEPYCNTVYLDKVCLASDYLILREEVHADNNLNFPHYNKNIGGLMDMARNAFYDNRDSFELIKRIPFVYGNNILIYKNKKI